MTVASQASNGLAFTVAVPGTIGGSVTQATGGAAVVGASVQALLTGVVKGSATTAANGTYSIPSLDPGTYEVWTTASGFSNDVRQGITVTSSTTTTVNVTMTAPGSMSGTITQSDGVTPIVGAAVTVFTGTTQRGTTNTNGSGGYSIAGLRSGSYTVRAANAGYRTKEQAASVSENANVTVNMSLDAASAGSVSYVYDEIGRLVQVTDQAGDSAIYRYDPVGNITAIDRASSTTVGISEFTPNKGPVGTALAISGSGFSATASQNHVTFGCGASCTIEGTVTSASPTQIVATVPGTAITGTFTVMTPNGSATSPSAFTVAASSAPSITGFTPQIGVAGTQVIVSGTNFDSVTSNDRTKINVSLATVSAATSTSLTATVPTLTASGPISVTTPTGSAVSATDFYVPPSPYGVSDVAFTSRLNMGTALTVTINAATKIGLLTFAGTAGQRISLLGTTPPLAQGGLQEQILGCDVNATILKPDGNALGAPTCMEFVGFIDATVLPTTGTYSILVDPTDNATGSVILTLYTFTDFTGTITAGGSSVLVPLDPPGVNATLTFSGTANQRVSLWGIGNIAGQIAFQCDVTATIVRASDNLTVANTCMEGSGFIDPVALPSTETYKIVIDPYSYAKGNLTLSLYTVPADVTGTLTINAAATPVSLQTPGQNASYTFTVASSQSITVRVTDNAIGPTDPCVFVALMNGASTITNGALCGNFDLFPQTLAAATYTVTVNPYQNSTGSLGLRVTSP